MIETIHEADGMKVVATPGSNPTFAITKTNARDALTLYGRKQATGLIYALEQALTDLKP